MNYFKKHIAIIHLDFYFKYKVDLSLQQAITLFVANSPTDFFTGTIAKKNKIPQYSTKLKEDLCLAQAL